MSVQATRLRHVFSDGRANVAHRPDVIVCRLADCADVIVELKVLVQHYTLAPCRILTWSASGIVEPDYCLEYSRSLLRCAVGLSFLRFAAGLHCTGFDSVHVDVWAFLKSCNNKANNRV